MSNQALDYDVEADKTLLLHSSKVKKLHDSICSRVTILHYILYRNCETRGVLVFYTALFQISDFQL